MNLARHSLISRLLGLESLKIYIQVFLLLGLSELIVGRVFLHVPALSSILLSLVSIIMNFEALIEFPILMSLTYFFWKNRNSYLTSFLFGLSSALLILVVLLQLFSILLLSVEILWLAFASVAFTTILFASAKRIFAELKEKKPSTVALVAFLVLVDATYFCFYIYLASFNLFTYWKIKIPEPLALFSLAQNLILFDSLALFFYALLVPSIKFLSDRRFLVKVALIPSIVVALLLAFLVAMPTGSRFDMAEIIALVLIMWGFTVAKSQIPIYIVMLWFFLVAALLLREKGQATRNFINVQEFIAAFLMFFAGFLNTSPYLLMGAIAVILFSGEIT
ncbi:hypothetical protein GWN65_04955 [Candidatus Bathyarchaeota archaeon]|nr:hypothetical protein [Candidatus Bathyarchaeota archaeon]